MACIIALVVLLSLPSGLDGRTSSRSGPPRSFYLPTLDHANKKEKHWFEREVEKTWKAMEGIGDEYNSTLEPCPGHDARWRFDGTWPPFFWEPHDRCDYDADKMSRVCAKLLDAMGNPLVWGDQGHFWQITHEDDGKPMYDDVIRRTRGGDSWCLELCNAARLVERVGCENVVIRCEATVLDWVMRDNYWEAEDHWSDHFGPPNDKCKYQGYKLAPIRQCLKEQCTAFLPQTQVAPLEIPPWDIKTEWRREMKKQPILSPKKKIMWLAEAEKLILDHEEEDGPGLRRYLDIIRRLMLRSRHAMSRNHSAAVPVKQRPFEANVVVLEALLANPEDGLMKDPENSFQDALEAKGLTREDLQEYGDPDVSVRLPKGKILDSVEELIQHFPDGAPANTRILFTFRRKAFGHNVEGLKEQILQNSLNSAEPMWYQREALSGRSKEIRRRRSKKKRANGPFSDSTLQYLKSLFVRSQKVAVGSSAS